MGGHQGTSGTLGLFYIMSEMAALWVHTWVKIHLYLTYILMIMFQKRHQEDLQQVVSASRQGIIIARLLTEPQQRKSQQQHCSKSEQRVIKDVVLFTGQTATNGTKYHSINYHCEKEKKNQKL